MMSYNFYGWEKADCPPVKKEYAFVKNPRALYDLLCGIWCRKTCAPRMQSEWTPENKTKGQCSITAFLAQDIFGGKVYGVPLKDGNFHCFNVVGDCVFDLTSGQFGSDAKNLVYVTTPDFEQFREKHFAKEEKFERYKYLKQALDNMNE